MRRITLILFALICLVASLAALSDLIFPRELPAASVGSSAIPNLAGPTISSQPTRIAQPQTPLGTKPESNKKSWLEKAANEISAVRSIAINLLIFLLLLTLIITFFWEIRRESVVIDPIDVPKNLAEKGYTPQAIAQRLAAEINEIQRAARLSGRRIEEGFELSASQIDFTVPTAGISYRGLVRYVRQILRRPERRIRGEILSDAGAIRIALRTNDGYMTPTDLWVASEGEMTKLIEKAAFEITFLVDPYLIATHCLWAEERKRKFKKTLQAISRCLTHTPAKRHHQAYVIRGNVFAFQRKFDQAEEQFRIAASLEPRYSSAYISWGNLKRAMRHFDDAAEMYEWARSLERREAYAWNNLGLVCNDRRMFRTALGYFKHAVRLNPRYANAWQNWGRALLRLGYYRDAEVKFARAVDLDPKFG